MVNLISLYLETTARAICAKAADLAARPFSFLSRSKGGSDMLKRLIAMPESSNFGMAGYADAQTPLLALWSLRSYTDYQAELARRSQIAHADPCRTVAGRRNSSLDTDELEAAGADAEAVIRTALLVLSTGHTEMPDWRALGHIVLKLRQRHGSDASAIRITVPPELPAPLHPVVEEVRQSLLADLPKMLDAATPIRKLFQQTPAFMGRYFWLNSGLAEVDQHERSASATWKKVTDGNDDEGALLTLFLCVAAGSPPKTMLTDRTAGTLIRKIRKSGLNPELATQYIQAHAPVAYQADYRKLWHGFLDEATATLTRDVDDGIQSALALLRRECHVKAS
jgi:hypothetical protein